tara:strand:+ start:1673 stop:2098 length:426 start_codon:yes stop_codon:yes gene_type:complete
MIYNRTITNYDQEIEINNIVGKPFSFFQSLKLMGIGSSRFIIESVSTNFTDIVNEVADINYCNIELRPNGVIINVTQQLNLFSWVIPYYQLVVFDSETFSIHAAGGFIKMVKNKNYSNNKSFIKKMYKLKTSYSAKNNLAV